MELLPAIVGLAVVDSINPSALLAASAARRPARAASGPATGGGVRPRGRRHLPGAAHRLLEWLRTRLGAATRERLLWLLGLIGFLLLADALGHFQG
jgi:hypothetical protein